MNKILIAILSLTVIACLLGSTGCRTPQKAASKHMYKAMDKDAKTVYNICSDIAPPIESTRDSFIYIQGKTVTLKGDTVYNRIDCDSAKLIGIRYVKVPQLRVDTFIRVDTFRTSSNTTKVDRAKEYALAKENKEVIEKSHKLKFRLNLFMWVAIILAVYTVLRWVVKAKWGINIP